MLDLRPLRYFVRIVDLGSMSRAAAEVGIAQPALSQHVASLEADFKVKLLERGPQGAKPTECGRVLYRHAQILLRQLAEARQGVMSKSSEVSGNVAIGLSITTAEVLSVPLLSRVLAKFPNVHLQIVSLPNRLLVEMLTNARLDIALLFDYRPSKDIISTPIAVEEMFFVTCRSGNAPSTNKRGASLAEISQQPLLMPCRPHSVRLLLEAALTKAGHPFQVAAEIDSVPSLIEAVESGMGATVLPWSAFHRYIGAGRLEYMSCSERLLRELSLSVSRVLPLSAAAVATREVIEEVIRELMSSGQWQGLWPAGNEPAAEKGT